MFLKTIFFPVLFDVMHLISQKIKKYKYLEINANLFSEYGKMSFQVMIISVWVLNIWYLWKINHVVKINHIKHVWLKIPQETGFILTQNLNFYVVFWWFLRNSLLEWTFSSNRNQKFISCHICIGITMFW